MDTFIYFIFSFAVYIQICEGLYSCNESIPTISYVESCPKNKTEWNIAARLKNCDSLAALQKCTERENFQYHCLENQRQTMTLEICAPIFYLQGYCARYNTDKKRVEENYDNGFKCLEFDEREKCTTRYPSTDAYKYQRCYKLKNQKPTQTAQSETTPIVTKKDLRNDTDDHIKTAFLVILALALAGVIVLFILFYKTKSLNLERFFKVLTCDDVETGPVYGTENEEGIQPQELTNEVDESSHLLTDETGRDEKATSDKDLAPYDSTISEPISGNNPFEKDTPPSDTTKSNNGQSLKPVSNNNISSKSTSSEAPDLRQVSNEKSAADSVTALHTSSSNVSLFESTEEETKKVVIDDPKAIPTGMPSLSPQSLLFDKSSLSKKNTSGSNAPDNSVGSSDFSSQNETDVSKSNLQYQAAAKSTPKDVPSSDDAPVLTLATDISTPGNNSSSENNPFDEDTTNSELSNGNPTPDSKAYKPMLGSNPFDEDTTISDFQMKKTIKETKI